MRIYLGALIVILGLAFIIARHDEYAALKGSQETASPNNAASAIRPDQKHPQENPKYSYWDSPSGHIFHAAFSWSGGTTIWAIILTLLAIADQTSQTRKAAEAALKQADHMVASERAWLVISSVTKSGGVIQPGFAPYYWWQVKNLGSTPARLIATQAHCKIDTTGLPKPMPEEPTFDERAVELHERILGPGDTLDFFSLWEKEDGTTFRDRLESLDQICLRAYGYIRYRTMFGSEICESRFCDYFNHVPKESIATDRSLWAIEFRPDLTAPAAYTKSN